MDEYHKIQSLFKRDPETNFKTFLMGEYSLPEFEYLKNNQWIFTEKVDGTNIRVSRNVVTDQVLFGGRTDNAQMPARLMTALSDLFNIGNLNSVFNEDDFCLYGEGYGAGIQKGGCYGPEQSFVLFDVTVGGWWLQRVDVEDIAAKLNIDVVPILGNGSLVEMVDAVRGGIVSKWGDFQAEGFVARPTTELRARSGARMITKLKTRDFK